MMIVSDGTNSWTIHPKSLITTRKRRLKKLDIPGMSGFIDWGFEPVIHEVTAYADDAPPGWLLNARQVSVSGCPGLPDGDYLLEELRATERPPQLWEVRIRLREIPNTYVEV